MWFSPHIFVPHTRMWRYRSGSPFESGICNNQNYISQNSSFSKLLKETILGIYLYGCLMKHIIFIDKIYDRQTTFKVNKIFPPFLKCQQCWDLWGVFFRRFPLFSSAYISSRELTHHEVNRLTSLQTIILNVYKQLKTSRRVAKYLPWSNGSLGKSSHYFNTRTL